MKYLLTRTRYTFVILFTVLVLCIACEEVEDPFVDRTVAPVLLVFDEVTGYLAGGGLTSVPVVTKSVTATNYTDAVVLSLSVYELDKSGILNHTVGIDSIPVSDLRIVFSKRDGSLPIEAFSDETGKVSISTTWEELGVTDVATIANATAAKTISIPVSWTGEHKEQSFARYALVVFSKAAS